MADSKNIKFIGTSKDLTGEVFNLLTVLRLSRCDGRNKYWTVRCACGKETTIRAAHLRKQQSCGCMKTKTQAQKVTKHGMNDTKEYKCWGSMKNRCYNPKSDSYPRYGGRGIQVCERWRDSFANFIADMGLAPSNEHSIERIDNDGNYEPNNCRWATHTEQDKNKSTSRLITYKGESKIISDWARQFGLSLPLLRSRLKRGWSIHDALTKNVQVHRRI